MILAMYFYSYMILTKSGNQNLTIHIEVAKANG